MFVPVRQVLPRGFDQLGVLHVPGDSVDILPRHECQVEDHLAETVFGASLAQLLDEIQEFPTREVDHGTVFPTLG